MKRKYDLGALLFAAMLLVLCVSYLTQCSSTQHRTETIAAATATAGAVNEAREEEIEREREERAERRPRNVREQAAEEEKEERAKVQGISRALQTAGADPEFRKTYGFPP